MPRELKRGSYKFDRDARNRFLETYARTGLVGLAVKASGVSGETVRIYTNENLEGFADEYEEAKMAYRDTIEAEIHRRAISGWEEPLIGGKDRDQIVTYVTRYSDRLLEFHAKRHIADYREKTQLDLNVKSGVIAIPVVAPSGEAWEEANKEIAAPERLDVKRDAGEGKGDEGGSEGA